MSISKAGFVKNGVVVPNLPLPEGAQVEIRLNAGPTEGPTGRPGPAQLRRMPREGTTGVTSGFAGAAGIT